jgi:hypothetical protein
MRGCRIVSTVMNDQTNKPETAGETGSETEAILGRPAEARQDRDLESADPKFRVYYERLLRLRNDLSNKRDAWREQELETQPKDRQQADAESATTVALRDAA